ncbi:hypothetical protein Zmor_027470 [Zophobas morio]|uniref:Uncharacterized protein n=1 Tax=Zophobas morio TaxID=2755281 RepID=A0AA38HNB1_9CUCU|nr:hypothetical protein Zmor_027470 [Zophobas morio]
MVIFSNSERMDMVILYAVETLGWPGNYGSSAFQIARFSVHEHLYQWYSISEIMMVPSSPKLTIVAVTGLKGYCNVKNKFWNASKNSLTSPLADLQLKVEFHSL